MGPVLGSARFTGEAIVGWLEKKRDSCTGHRISVRFHKERGESKVGGWVGAAPLSAHLRPGPCVIMHCRLRRHKLFIFLKSDFGQQFKTQAVYRLRRYMYRLRRYRQQQQLLMLPHLGYI